MTKRTETDSLDGVLRGEVIRPGDDGYDEARALWNGMIDRRPAAIVRCRGVADVQQAIRFARDHGLPVTAKGGGHHVAGTALCDDGIVLDLAHERSPHRCRSTPGQGGSRCDLGSVRPRGAGVRPGHAGWSPLGHRRGRADVGRRGRIPGPPLRTLCRQPHLRRRGPRPRHARDRLRGREPRALFWGLRGGGASLGVVTSFEFSLHEVGPQVMTALAYHPFENVQDVLRFYRAFAADAPEELACYAFILKVPPVHPFPEAHHGRISVGMGAVHSGDLETGATALEPLETFGDPILSFVQESPYAAFQQALDAGSPDGARYYYKSQFIHELSDGLIEAIGGSTEPLGGEYTMIGIEPLGGAIGRVDASATAFPHRDAAFNLSAWAGWIDPAEDDEHIAWARSFHKAIGPHAMAGVYVNYLDRDDAGRANAAFGENGLRLKRVQATYDPDNLFRTHRSLVPSV